MEGALVKQWLDSLKLCEYEQRFTKHGYITMKQCVEAKHDILEEVGILNEKDFAVLKANLDFLKIFHQKNTNSDTEAETFKLHSIEKDIRKINSNSESIEQKIDETIINSEISIEKPYSKDKSNNFLASSAPNNSHVKPYKKTPIMKTPIPAPRRNYLLSKMGSQLLEINNESQKKTFLDNELNSQINEKLNSRQNYSFEYVPHNIEKSILDHVYENCYSTNQQNLEILGDAESHHTTAKLTSNKDTDLRYSNKTTPGLVSNSYEKLNNILNDTNKDIKTTDETYRNLKNEIDMIQGISIGSSETVSETYTSAFDTSSNNSYFILNSEKGSISCSSNTLSTDGSEPLFDYYRHHNDKNNLNNSEISLNNSKINYKDKNHLEKHDHVIQPPVELLHDNFNNNKNNKLNQLSSQINTKPCNDQRKSGNLHHNYGKENQCCVGIKILKRISENSLKNCRNLSLDTFMAPSNDEKIPKTSISSIQLAHLSQSVESLLDLKSSFENSQFLLIKKNNVNKNSAFDNMYKVRADRNHIEIDVSKKVENKFVSFISDLKKDESPGIIIPINNKEKKELNKSCMEKKVNVKTPVYENLNEPILKKNKNSFHEMTSNDSEPVNDEISKDTFSISNYKIKTQPEVDDRYVKLDNTLIPSLYSAENSDQIPNGFFNAHSSDEYELQTDNYVLDYLSKNNDTECNKKRNRHSKRATTNNIVIPLESNDNYDALLRSSVCKRESSKYINSETVKNIIKLKGIDSGSKDNILSLGEEEEKQLSRNISHALSCTSSNIHQSKQLKIKTSNILNNNNSISPILPAIRNTKRLTNISTIQVNSRFNLLSTKNFMEGFLLKSDQSNKPSLKTYYTLDENALTPVIDHKKKDKELVEIKLKRIIGVLADSQHLSGSSFEIFLKSPDQVLRYTCEQSQYKSVWITQIARAISVVCEEDRDCINSFTKAGNVFAYCHVENAWNLVWMHLHAKCLYTYSCNSRFEETDLRKVKSIKKSTDDGHLTNLPIIKLLLVENQCLMMQTETTTDFDAWYDVLENARTVKCPSRLTEHFLSADNVPVLVEKCIKFINKYGLEVEGIYRKSGQLSRTCELFNSFIEDAHGTIIHDNDVIEVSSCLKKFFKQLDETLFPKKHYNEWVEAYYTNKKYKVERYKGLFSSLSVISYATAKILICHLAKVVRFKSCNKMDSMNISCIFSPLLFSEQGPTDSGYSKISQQMEILKDLLENYNKIFDINMEEEEAQQLRMQEAVQRMQQLNAESNNSINMIKELKVNELLLSVIFNDSTTGSSETYNFNVTEETTAEHLEEQLIKRIGTSVGEHYYFFEVICNGELERLVHYEEKVMDVVMKYQKWPKEFTLGATFVYKASNVLQNYPHLRNDTNLSLSSMLKYAKKKTFKKFAFSFIKYNLSYRKDNKSSGIIGSWYVEHLDIYSGNQHKRSPPYQHCISFYEKKQSPNTNGFFGHCLSFDNQQEYNTWLSTLLFSQHSDGYRTPKKLKQSLAQDMPRNSNATNANTSVFYSSPNYLENNKNNKKRKNK